MLETWISIASRARAEAYQKAGAQASLLAPVELARAFSDVGVAAAAAQAGLAPFFEGRSRRELERVAAGLEQALAAIADRARALPLEAHREFARACARAMDARLREQGRAEGRAPSLYRAFDAFDRALGLDYGRDVGMKTDLACAERLYEGAGAGVQTSYATILAAIESLRLPIGGRVIDLGSGYGRVGLMLALLRPDAEFIGYEYVPHRVDVASAAARRAGVDERARFFAQDLGEASFEIPEADVYYMYDPFCRETYARVFARIERVADRRPCAVAIKGNGTAWFLKAIEGRAWSSPERCDEGTLSVFRSAPRPRPAPEAAFAP